MSDSASRGAVAPAVVDPASTAFPSANRSRDSTSRRAAIPAIDRQLFLALTAALASGCARVPTSLPSDTSSATPGPRTHDDAARPRDGRGETSGATPGAQDEGAWASAEDGGVHIDAWAATEEFGIYARPLPPECAALSAPVSIDPSTCEYLYAYRWACAGIPEFFDQPATDSIRACVRAASGTNAICRPETLEVCVDRGVRTRARPDARARADCSPVAANCGEAAAASCAAIVSSTKPSMRTTVASCLAEMCDVTYCIHAP